MVRAFFGNRSVVLLLLPVLMAVFFFLNIHTNYYPPMESLNLGLWGNFTAPPLLGDLIAMSLILSQAITINIVFNKNEFMERNNYFASLFFVVFMSQFNIFYHLNGLGIALFLFCAGFHQILKLNQNEDGRKNIFNAAALFGLAMTLYPMLILFIPFLFWLIWILRPFILRETVLVLFGLSLPVIYILTYYFIIGKDLMTSALLPTNLSAEGHHFITFVGLISITFIACLSLIFKKLRQSSIRLKKLLRGFVILLFFSLLLGIISFLIIGEVEAISLSVLSLTFLITFGFGDKEPAQAPELFFYLLLIFSASKFFLPLTYSLPEIF